jgi:hypothetical protein
MLPRRWIRSRRERGGYASDVGQSTFRTGPGDGTDITIIEGRALRISAESEQQIPSALQPPRKYLDYPAPKIDELYRETGAEPHEIMSEDISQIGQIKLLDRASASRRIVNRSWRNVNVGDRLKRSWRPGSDRLDPRNVGQRADPQHGAPRRHSPDGWWQENHQER